MSPLPKPDPAVETQLGSDCTRAYRICLKYEAELSGDNTRPIRILGFLLLYTTNDGVCVYLANSIFSCNDDPEILVNLGLFFEKYVLFSCAFLDGSPFSACVELCPSMKYRGRTPATSTHPSRLSFEQHWQDRIAEAPKNHKDAKHLALIRDNWRCVVTGHVDYNAPVEASPELVGNPCCCTECAHIIPEATFFDVQEKSNKFDYASCILTLLQLFRYDVSSFNGEKVHSLINVLTMSKDFHEWFDRLSLYFEAVPGKENYYQVNHFLKRWPFTKPLFVQFSTNDPQYLPVPSPELLALHATCCKVAHMSGAAEHIDKVYRDAEQTGVLASDGTSNDILSFKLMSLMYPSLIKIGE